MNKKKKGKLYIVSTPIGNIQDITYRAVKILQSVNVILAENIQHTKILLNYFNIKKNIIAYHKHNENNQVDNIIHLLRKKKIALVSNAGTPIINDPGYKLVHTCHKKNIKVIPIPGACAAITALSTSGLPSHEFYYKGFIPKKKSIRINFLQKIKQKTQTVILYESCHRILTSIQDMQNILGPKKKIVLAKEITKKWEKIKYGTIIEILHWLTKDPCRQKGEMVILIKGSKKKQSLSINVKNTLLLLMKDLSTKQSIEYTSKIHSIHKNDLYKYTIRKFKHDKK